MPALRAGFGKVAITPKLGAQMVGYAGRPSGATDIHDPLFARALVLEDNTSLWAVISCDLCYLFNESVAEVRAAAEQRVGIPPSHLFLATTHTHSGPHDRHPQNWDRRLPELIADAVEAGYAARQPARLGAGYGFLYGYSINRRWLDRPVDPAVAVLRVDDAEGKLLGLLSIYASHAVVMGNDNLHVSGDWPGNAMQRLEEEWPGSTCLYFQGGAGDINPLVEGVRKRLVSGDPIRAIGQISTYYGSADDPAAWNIGDRGGGSFDEVAELGAAFAQEVTHVARGIAAQEPEQAFWSEQVVINAAAEPGEHPLSADAVLATERPEFGDGKNLPAELMLMQLGDLLLVGQPGEVFSETAVNLRTRLRALGYRVPMLASYANGWWLYLPEPEAFAEGGYEPGWAVNLNISRQFQPRAWQAIRPLAAKHAPRTASASVDT